MTQCQLTGCKQKARWGLYYTLPTGEKEWKEVCDKHEREIAAVNLIMSGGHLPLMKLRGKKLSKLREGGKVK